MAADPYSTLGVAKTATEAEIKKAYRKLAKELHPDRNKDNPKAAERFSAVTQAYDLLSDADKRAKFDRGEIDADGNPAMPFGFGAGGPGGGFRGQPSGFDFQGEGADINDLFEGLFGGRARRGGGPFEGAFRQQQRGPARGANIGYRLKVPFVDAATLAPQRITLADGKTIDLKLPAGLDTGTQMRLAGKGEAGPGGAGDAIVTLEVEPHAFFQRKGDDIEVEVPLTLAEAVEGGPVKVPTVDGPVMLKFAPGTSSGTRLRLRGKGFSTKAGGRGDQYVTAAIVVPKGDATLDAWAAEAKGRLGNPRARLGV